MQYKVMEAIAKKVGISLGVFYGDANITYKQKKKMEEEDFVPSYVRLMFMSYIEKEHEKRKDIPFDTLRSDFQKRAESLGYEINSDGFVEIPLFSDGLNEIEVNYHHLKRRWLPN